MICRKCLMDRCCMAGQGFTKWICQKCGKEFVHHNTNTPKVCKTCSEQYKLCEECGCEVNNG